MLKSKVKSLTIPYPDFQLYELIDPDQFDENNRDIVDKINEILTSVNTVLSEVGTGAGSDAIPSNVIQGVSGNSVHAQLQSLKNLHDSLAVLVSTLNSDVQFRDMARINDQNVHKNGSELDHPDQSVTTRKLRDLSVTTPKVENSAITTPKLNNLSVTTDKLANNSTTSEKIANQAVTSPKIADNAIQARHIVDGQVGDALIGNRTVNGNPQNPLATTGNLTEMLNVIARRSLVAQSRAELLALNSGWTLRPLTFQDLKDKNVQFGWLRAGNVNFSAFKLWRM